MSSDLRPINAGFGNYQYQIGSLRFSIQRCSSLACWTANVTITTALLCVLLAFALPHTARACSESDYKNHLTGLQKLGPAVSGDSPSQSSLASFFDALPPDFACFIRIFGFEESPAPLYSNPQLHALFPKIAKAVPPDKYAKKLVSLSVSARWQADQTGALQDAVRSTVRAHTKIFVDFAGQQTVKSEASVWWFLFSDPHPRPLSPKTQDAICEANKRSCGLSKNAYARARAGEHIH